MSPTISQFLGITIRLYYEEHGVPHFHAYYGEFEATLAIDTLEVLAGDLPPRVLGLVVEWASERRAGLLNNWNRARRHLPLRTMGPLK